MKKVLLGILITLCVGFTTCKRSGSHVANTKEDLVEEFDSTYYFMIQEAYSRKDTVLLHSFLEAWAIESAKLVPIVYNDSMTKAIYEIYNTVYFPFDYTKYGWKYGKARREYCILQNTITYVLADSIGEGDGKVIRERKTITDFKPNPDLDGAKKILDVGLFNKTMDLFLSNERKEKIYFIRSAYPFLDIFFMRDDYYTQPIVNCIEIDKLLKKAVATVVISESGINICLERKDGKWTIVKIVEAWVA